MICATILLQIDFVIEILKKYANNKMYRSETKKLLCRIIILVYNRRSLLI